jgi:hypothetical protein
LVWPVPYIIDWDRPEMTAPAAVADSGVGIVRSSACAVVVDTSDLDYWSHRPGGREERLESPERQRRRRTF